ncbi:LYS5 [Candida margitis]|uniref:LYS5 n=1 Tax=Candida margitis TaxID=1775924 RepID=UPI002226FBBE|nr:LYS5 [Candida margitis]KAI5968293.1 LYS5 [Candida margitis]
MVGSYDFENSIIVVYTRITPNLVEFLQNDFNFELTLRLLDDLKLQLKISQLVPPLRYKQLISTLFTRYTLNTVLGKPAFQNLSFEYNRYGKPCIEGLEFNTSSSNNVVVVVINSFPVGIDLSHSMQNISPTNYREQFAPVFNKSELDQLDSYFKFNHFWTLKEAFTKFLGCGLNVNLADFHFQLDAEDEFNENDYFVTQCPNDQAIKPVNVRWYDKIATNADKLYEEKNEFVVGFANEFYCRSNVIEKAHGDLLPVICSVVTQQRNAEIKTYEMDFLTALAQSDCS